MYLPYAPLLWTLGRSLSANYHQGEEFGDAFAIGVKLQPRTFPVPAAAGSGWSKVVSSHVSGFFHWLGLPSNAK